MTDSARIRELMLANLFAVFTNAMRSVA